MLFLLTVLPLVWGAWWLGEWQFSRLEERRDFNRVVERNEGAPTTPVSEVLAPGRPVTPQDEWRRVSATGVYAADDTVVVRYQTREGASGVDVVVPLITPQGPALLVNRGWMMTRNAGSTTVDVPPPPSGEVTVTGWVRADAQGDSTAVKDLSTRAVSSQEIGPALEREVYGGFLDLEGENPAPDTSLTQAELPDLGEGPHFFYGLQWWFFGLLAVVGFIYLAFDEWRGRGRNVRDVAAGGPPSRDQD